MTTVLDNALASQLQQAFQGSGGRGAATDPAAVQGLEDEFQAALGAVQPAQSGQIVNGAVVVDSTASTTAAQAVTPSAPVAASREISSVDSTGSNFLIEGLAEVRDMFTKSSTSIMNLSESKGVTSIDRLVNMQIEVANYSLLVDVSSKVAGKTVQGMDTLMR